MKLWVDDLREMPNDYDFWAKTYDHAIEILSSYKESNWILDEISLDNDLGENSLEGRKIVLWMAENDFWPKRVLVHTSNPVAREYMIGMIDRYKFTD